MTETTTTASARDINILMREGHVHIADVERLCIELVEHHARRIGRPARLLEIGCASGIMAETVAARVPELAVIAHEDYPPFAELARTRLQHTRVQLVTGPLEELTEPVDILLSAGAHHHLPAGYLAHARKLLGDDGVFVLADEFCPEYCNREQREHVASAAVVHVVNGYVLTSDAERDMLVEHGMLPPRAIDMEARRRRALWHWYRYVVDEAMRGDHIEVAVAELTSARDDLVTGCEAEHKLAPSILERQLQLAGFRVTAKHVFGPTDDPSLQSIIAYEAVLAARA
ncbi:MAG TPA: class I SAM-dependent methyltransferase [Nannocystaceae bacterium]|nr:class I SAM-dependent methyltransferase [Nannocystaceae bacterium]